MPTLSMNTPFKKFMYVFRMCSMKMRARSSEAFENTFHFNALRKSLEFELNKIIPQTTLSMTFQVMILHTNGLAIILLRYFKQTDLKVML